MWAVKIVAKIILGRIPFRHSLLRKFGMFKHGCMDDTAYALKIFNLHIDRAFSSDLPSDAVILELGSGDSLISALIAKSHNVKTIYHVDVGQYATLDLEFYKKCASELNMLGVDAPDLSNIGSTDEVLKYCNANYLTNGLESLKQIPSNSVDFIWSHSVVEHIRKNDFDMTMKELRRILKKDGRVSHNVDLQDHLSKSLNNMRFSEKFWENEIVANSGFYTNRIPYDAGLDSMRRAGFEVIDSNTGRWDTFPTPHSKMAEPFCDIDESDLCVRTYDVLLKAA